MIHYLSEAKRSKIKGVALLRLDFNTKDGDWRMLAVLPTVKLLMKMSRAVVIVSHYGRPEPVVRVGQSSTFALGKQKEFSLRKNAADLSRLIGKKVTFLPHFDFKKIQAEIQASPRGSVFLLENVRFIEGEEKNELAVAKILASLADFYVNDAFAVSHRAQSSVAAIAGLLPSYAGMELEQEIDHLSLVMRGAKRPLVLVLGGAKAEDKLGVLVYFKNKADSILLGGGSANTILALRGMDVKKSLRDTDPKSLGILGPLAARHNIIAPTDYAWDSGRILDIGPLTVKDFSKIVAGAKTVVWSGPLGLTEKRPYEKGSVAIARAIVRNRKAFSLVGGGETVAFVKKQKLEKKFSFVSTGGGAMLEFLAGEKLPGIEALEKASKKG